MTFALVNCHFRLNLAIFDLSIFGLVACHFHFDIAMFALRPNNFCLNDVNFEAAPRQF